MDQVKGQEKNRGAAIQMFNVEGHGLWVCRVRRRTSSTTETWSPGKGNGQQGNGRSPGRVEAQAALASIVAHKNEMKCSFVARNCTKGEGGSEVADAARGEEARRILKYGAFEMPMERSDAAKLHPDATLSMAAMPTYIKNAEKPLGMQKCKGRFVCLGDKMWSKTDGGKCITLPIGVMVTNCCSGLGASRVSNCEDGPIDVGAAYLQCKWPRELPKHYLVLPEEMVCLMSQKQYDAWKSMKNPVFEMLICIYGHQRSGKVFAEAVAGDLALDGFRRGDADSALLQKGRALVPTTSSQDPEIPGRCIVGVPVL